MLNASFVNALRDMADKAQAPSQYILVPPGEPDGGYWARDPDGPWELYQPSVPNRKHKLRDLASLVRWLRHGRATSPADSIEEATAPPSALSKAVIWCSVDRIELRPNGSPAADDAGTDKLVIDLGLSESFKWLQGLAKGKTFLQYDLVRALRTVMAPAATEPNDFLALVRTVNFSVATEDKSDLQHQRVSLGKSVRAEAGGIVAFPEEVVFSCPVLYRKIFTGQDLATAMIVWYETVRCVLELHPAKQMFELTVLPGEIEKAIARTEAAIWCEVVQALGDTAVLVCCGEP